MAEPNHLLRAARERTPSRWAPGEGMTRNELAEAANAYLWTATHRRYELDGHHIAKWERGLVRFPIAPYRAALRAVLGVANDIELGFTSRHVQCGPRLNATWSLDTILDTADDTTRTALLNRRDTLAATAALGGAALLAPLQRWLEPLALGTVRVSRAAFSVEEIEGLETVAATFRAWRTFPGLGRRAVLGQLGDLIERLRGTPPGPLTNRAFLVAAELAKIAASMANEDGAQASAQRHYLTAVHMAKAAAAPSFAAVTLAALARQAYDAGHPDDGLELVALAQHGTRRTATPGLRAMLATRQAWGHACRGEATAFHRAVGYAEEVFAERDPATEPRWLAGFDAAELAGVIGARFRDLARHDPRQAPHAVAYIKRALALRNPDRPRNRAMDLIGLARVHLLTHEPEHSVELITEALPLVDPRRPGRMGRRLTDWQREAAPFATVPAVRHIREMLRELVNA